MKIDFNNLELININENIYKIKYDNQTLKFWSPNIKIPFGLENEYNKLIIKGELDDSDNNKHKNEIIHLKKLINIIEKNIKKKLDLDDDTNGIFKSIIKKRNNKLDFVECRIKKMKTNILTSIEFEDKINNYLKTIYDLPKQCYVKLQFEIDGLFDYRNENNEKNKVGLVVYVSKIIVLK